MKLKIALLALSSLIAGTVSSNAASFFVNNIVGGPAVETTPGDVLHADKDNALMATGFVTMGYFLSTITQDQIDTVAELYAVLQTPTNYITLTSAIPGLATSGIGDGYVDGVANGFSSASPITIGNALLGRTIYSIVTNQISLAAFAAAELDGSNQVGLVNLGPIKDDVPDNNQYFSNPIAPATLVIGAYGTIDITGDTHLGNGEYGTFKMGAVPEPSAALLGALGALGLLRRRRN